MADIVDNILRNNMTVSDVKCRTEMSVEDSAPGVDFDKLSSSRGGKDVGGDIEQLERRKKRRRKAKRKNPYNKQMSENRGGKKNIRIRAGKPTYEQPVAPYNSNQFLIEDHNDLQDFDMKLLAAANRGSDNLGSDMGPARTGRVRDPSFTSAESDEDFFYSSPEDEEEFLTKEFSNTYRDLHVEGLASMSKTELIQTVIQLEEKVDSLQKLVEDRSTEEETDKSPDKVTNFQSDEIAKLVLANQKLLNENTRLREVNGKCCSSPSSEDSESDSTSSSGSSDMNSSGDDAHQPSHNNHLPHKHMNGDVHKENDINMDPTDNT